MDDDITPTLDPNSSTGIYIPPNLQDCFLELDRMLSASMRDCISACSEDDLIRHHFGLGMWMRNNWGLWSESSPLKQFFDSQGKYSADDMSSMILKSYWQHLNRKVQQVDG
jgi:hypothetical protein